MQEKDREKERVGGRPAKLNEKKGDRDLEREIKNKGHEKKQEHVRHFLHKKSFWKFRVVVVQNNVKEMNKKSVLYVQSCFFAN